MNISSITFKYFLPAVVAAASLTGVSSSFANEKYREERITSLDEIYELVENGLPRTIGDDNSALAKNLLSVKTGAPITENLNVEHLAESLFKLPPKLEGDCDARKGQLSCFGSEGEKAGAGAYSQLKLFSESSEVNLRFAKRPAANGKLVPATMENKEAYERAVALLTEGFAVSEAEIPVAPKNARNPYPVRTVNVALARSQKPEKIVPVEKLVTLPRGLAAGSLGWVPGPGEWAVSLNDEGVNTASVRNWADMSRYGEGLRAEQIKSRTEIVEELVERLQHEGVQKLASARSHIAIARLEGAEVPVPVLRVFASPQERKLSEEEQAKTVSTAGVVFEVALFNSYDEDQKLDD